MIRYLIFLLFPFFLFAGQFDEHLEKTEDLQYLSTSEDRTLCHFYSGLYEMALKREKPAGSIPKTLHFIWLGREPFPKTSVKNVKEWIDRHPGWKVKFWTDVGQSAPDDRMQVNSFTLFPLEELKELYDRSENFDERSQLVRHAILLNEGGLYVDHDVKCLRPFDPLQENHDFFCGLKPLAHAVQGSSVNPSSHLLGSSAQHPILKAAKKWLIAEGGSLDKSLGKGIKEAHNRTGRKDIVFPPDHFSLSNSKKAIFAVHGQERSRSYPLVAIGIILAVCGFISFVLWRKKCKNI